MDTIDKRTSFNREPTYQIAGLFSSELKHKNQNKIAQVS
jgi:hypothetical protein